MAISEIKNEIEKEIEKMIDERVEKEYEERLKKRIEENKERFEKMINGFLLDEQLYISCGIIEFEKFIYTPKFLPDKYNCVCRIIFELSGKIVLELSISPISLHIDLKNIKLSQVIDRLNKNIMSLSDIDYDYVEKITKRVNNGYIANLIRSAFKIKYMDKF